MAPWLVKLLNFGDSDSSCEESNSADCHLVPYVDLEGLLLPRDRLQNLLDKFLVQLERPGRIRDFESDAGAIAEIENFVVVEATLIGSEFPRCAVRVVFDDDQLELDFN